MKGPIASIAAGILVACSAQAQQAPFARLPFEQLDVVAPTGRVAGPPGQMRVMDGACPAHPDTGVRRRIVDVAVQEWAFFGFGVVDQTNVPDVEPPRTGNEPRRRRRPSWLNPEESLRVADTIAAYWSITRDGSWILSRQNERWNGPDGVGARWRDPWSAAFISWVMCESGLDEQKFHRAIAHHTYIDQAIEARDDPSSAAAFVAYDVGEQPIEPGDLLCAARRPNYRRLQERRAALGEGIRSHCDIVVEVDAGNDRILVIGGNVRGAVSLKIHAAVFAGDEQSVESVGRGRRSIFAHLKLDAEPIATDALATSPTFEALGAEERARLRERLLGDLSGS